MYWQCILLINNNYCQVMIEHFILIFEMKFHIRTYQVKHSKYYTWHVIEFLIESLAAHGAVSIYRLQIVIENVRQYAVQL